MVWAPRTRWRRRFARTRNRSLCLTSVRARCAFAGNCRRPPRARYSDLNCEMRGQLQARISSRPHGDSALTAIRYVHTAFATFLIGALIVVLVLWVVVSIFATVFVGVGV